MNLYELNKTSVLAEFCHSEVPLVNEILQIEFHELYNNVTDLIVGTFFPTQCTKVQFTFFLFIWLIICTAKTQGNPKVRNEPLQVEIGETRFISSRSLLSKDLDTDADQLLYIVKQLPDHGELILSRAGREDKIIRENEHFSQNDGKWWSSFYLYKF